MTARGKVFLLFNPTSRPDEPPRDLSSLELIGDVTVVFQQSDHPAQRPLQAALRAQEIALGFDFERDFVAWAGGDIVGFAALALTLGCHGGGRPVRVLRWHRDRDPVTKERIGGHYVPVLLPVLPNFADPKHDQGA